MTEHSPEGYEQQGSPHAALSQQSQAPGQPQASATQGMPQSSAATSPVRRSSTLGVLALIAGILAFLLGFIPIFGLIVALGAVALALPALIKRQPKGLAVTALVLGGIALLTSLIMTIVFAFAVTNDTEFSRGFAAAKESNETTKEVVEPPVTEKPQAPKETEKSPVSKPVETSKPAAKPEPETQPKPEAKPKPEKKTELGTVEAPFSQPYVAKGLLGGEKYKLRARIIDANAGQRVKDWNMFNPTAPSGFKYVVVKYTMTGIDPDGVVPSLASFDMSLATKEGNRYDEEFVVLGDGMSSMADGPKLYPGSKFSGFSVYVVPKKAKSFLIYDNGNYVSL